MSEKMQINFKRTCSCPDSHINCLTSKEWVKGQVAIWEFYYESRDIRDKDIHPAVFPIALPKKCIELFTHKGELVLDPFVGIGTTLVAARDLERNAVGFDLNPKYIDFTNKRLLQSNMSLFTNNIKQIAICDDAIVYFTPILPVISIESCHLFHSILPPPQKELKRTLVK
jgi:DNA modification methylase